MASHAASAAPSPTRAFAAVWAGQTVSRLGSGLTSFVLGAWVLDAHHSATEFGWFLLAASLPAALVQPAAGILVDRFERRATMIVSDVLSAALTLLVIVQFATGHLSLWAVLATAIGYSTLSAIQELAYSAALAAWVPQQELTRANGIVQVGNAASVTLAPVLGGFLFTAIGLPGVLTIDLASFAIGVTTLLRARILRRPDAIDPALRFGVADLYLGAVHHRAHPRLFALLALLVLMFLSIGTLHVLVPTLVIREGGTLALGGLGGFCGGGMAAGALAVSLWGGPRRRSNGVLLGISGVGAGLVGLSASSGLAGWFVSSTLFLAAVPLVIACGASIYQSEVPLHEQGRVLAFRNLLVLLAAPTAHLTAPALARALTSLPHFGEWQVHAGVESPDELSFRLLFLCLAAFVLLVAAAAAALRALLARGTGTDPRRT